MQAATDAERGTPSQPGNSLAATGLLS